MLEAVLWAIKTPVITETSDKIVMIVVADYAGEEWTCWPKQKTIAERCNLTARTVAKCLNRLETMGIIKRTPRFGSDGSRLSDLITILTLPKMTAPPETNAAENAANFGSPPELISAQESSHIEPVKEPTRLVVGPLTRRDAIEKCFERFWSGDGLDERTGYPKREGSNPKDPARKKFAAALAAGVNPETIIAAADRLNAHHRQRGSYGSKYVPQAVTWLSQKRWENDDGVAPAGGQGPRGSDSGGASFFDIAMGNG